MEFKAKLDIKEFVVVVISSVISSVLVYVFIWIVLNFNSEELKEIHTKCGSDSMGLIFDCNDTIYTRPVTYDTILKKGTIYIYQKGSGKQIIHRFMKCFDEFCTKLIFKGDNNRYADGLINRSQVLQEVIQVRFG